MKDYTDINLEELNSLEKITLVKYSDFGFIVVVNLKLQEVKLKNYAQYSNCIEFIGRPPRKRKNWMYRIKPNDEFALFEGTLTQDDFKDYKQVSQDKDLEATVTDYGTCFGSSIETFLNGRKDYIISNLKGE